MSFNDGQMRIERLRTLDELFKGDLRELLYDFEDEFLLVAFHDQSRTALITASKTKLSKPILD
jgi:hypothetical protein